VLSLPDEPRARETGRRLIQLAHCQLDNHVDACG
jgi:hypothetical protein